MTQRSWLKSSLKKIQQKRARKKLRKLLIAVDSDVLRLREFLNSGLTQKDLDPVRQKIDYLLQNAATRGQPMIVDLKTNQTIDIDRLEKNNLRTSLDALSGVGNGAIIYFVDSDSIQIGAGTQLRDYAILEVGGRLETGENCVIGAYTWLQASGVIQLGRGVIIGPHCSIVSTSHNRPTDMDEVRFSPLIKGKISIGDNTWIGANVSITMGVSIGRNVTIGAGSVVTRDIPDNAIAFGAPCRPMAET